MEEGEILLDDWEEGDDWRLQVLAVEDVSVLGHVPGGVEQVLQVAKELLILAGQLLPSSSKARDGSQVQTAGQEYTQKENELKINI